MIKNVNGIQSEMTPEEEAEFLASLPIIEPQPTVIPKMLLWTRLTDAEAEAVSAAMAAQPARMQGIWNAATEVRSDSEFFGTLEAFLTAVLGADRAAALLQLA